MRSTLRPARVQPVAFAGIVAAHLVLGYAGRLGAQQSEFVRGDTDGNRLQDISDPIRTLLYLFRGGADLPCRDAADANDDASVDVGDPIFTLGTLFTGGAVPPPPWPDCGRDPTPDDLGCREFDSCDSFCDAPAPPALELYDLATREASFLASGSAPGAHRVAVSGPSVSIEVPVTDNAFVVEVPIETAAENRRSKFFFSAIAECLSESAPVAIDVTHDALPPELIVDFPVADETTFDAQIDVGGRVSDVLSGADGLEVRVDGQPAALSLGVGTNATWIASVSLDLGDNEIDIEARDALGNISERSLRVERVTPPTDRASIAIVSGNRQPGGVLSRLAEPIVVRLTRGDGSPLCRKLVSFDVTRSDGRLVPVGANPDAEGAIFLQTRTDADGLASVEWRLGTDAGAGNQRVRVTSRDVAGEALFCASARPGPATQINLSGNEPRRGAASTRLPDPIRVRVSDGCNGIAGIPVLFEVVSGGGKLGGEDALIVETGSTGHAETSFELGSTPGNQEVQISLPGDESLLSVVVFAVESSPGAATVFEGLVLDNSSQPLRGAELTLVIGDMGFFATSDDGGRFRFDDLGTAHGPARIAIDGTTVDRAGAIDVSAGSFPALQFDNLVVVEGAVNGLGEPIRLPRLDPANAVSFDNSEDVVLTVRGLEGLEMRVRAGSMRLADGSVPSPEGPAILSLDQVHHDDVPMPMPDGAAPPFAWTLQPSGATFDPPIEVSYPNLSGLPVGATAYFLSFDHDTGRFEIVSTGRVSNDGARIESDPGGGLGLAGWGCNCPPYSVTADCCSESGGGGGPGFGANNQNQCPPVTCSISGDDWSFVGKSLTLTATVDPPGGTFAWTVTGGAVSVNGGTSSSQLVLDAVAPSLFPGDVEVSLTYTLSPNEMCASGPFSLTVYDIDFVNAPNPLKIAVPTTQIDTSRNFSADLHPQGGSATLDAVSADFRVDNLVPTATGINFDLVGVRLFESAAPGDQMLLFQINGVICLEWPVTTITPHAIGPTHDTVGTSGDPGPGGVQASNELLNDHTSPAIFNLPAPQVIRGTIYVRWLEVDVVDQFGDPLGDFYEGADIVEDGKLINQKLALDSTYLDPVGWWICTPPPLPDENDPRAAPWITTASPIPMQPFLTVQNIKIALDDLELTTGIVNRTVRTDPATQNIIIAWP